MRPSPALVRTGQMGEHFGTTGPEPKAQLWGPDMGEWVPRRLSGREPGSWKWLGTGDVAPYQGLHHIGFVVPKRFGSKENVHQVVAAYHLQDRGTGAEGTAAAAPVSK